MAEGGDDRQPGLQDGARDQLGVEGVHLLEAAAPARQDDHVGQGLEVAPAERAGDAHGRVGALDLDRVDDDAHVRVALPDGLLQVVDHGARRRGEDRHRQGKERKPALPVVRERALGLEPALQLLQPRPQLAHVIEFDLVDDEPDGSVLGPVVDSAAEDEHLAVLGQRRHAPRVVGVDEGVDQALTVADDEAVVALGALLHAADLALEQEGGQGPELAADLVGELGDGVWALGFLGPDHAV